MKNILLPLLLVLMFSCTEKEDNTIEVQQESVSEQVTRALGLPLITPDVVRMHDLIISADYQIGILADANLGYLSYEGNAPSFKANGVFPRHNDLQISINELAVAATQENGGILVRDAGFANFYGREATISVRENGRGTTESIYIPQVITANRLEPVIPNTLYISREQPNILSWAPDPENKLGVLVLYELFDRENYYESEDSQIESSFFLTEDNGRYDLGELIRNEEVKSIKITLIRLNAIEYVTQNGDKLMIGAKTADHHFYMIER